MRKIDLADFASSRAGERAALVPEQFVFDQPFRNCRAVQRDKGLLAPARQMVNRAREKLLAGAAFTQEQRGGIRCGYALNLLADFTNGSMLADDARKSVGCCVLFAAQQILAEQFLLTRAALHQKLQMIEVNGLLQKIKSPFLHGRDSLFHRAERGQKNHRNGGVGVLCRAQEVETESAGR